MAKYIIASTSGPSGRRPWPSRLQGVGDYQKAVFAVPTDSSSGNDNPGAVTGGLGLDLSSIPAWAYLAAAAAAYFLFFKPKR
jgi:hypothetical protein